MKNKTIGLIVGFLLISCLFACASGNQGTQPQTMAGSVPFSRGVHFTGWFEGFNNSKNFNFGRYGEQDFADVKRLGVDVIRVPINLPAFTSPDYTIDPLFLKLLDKAVDWAEKYQIYIILDNAPADVTAKLDNSIRNFLVPVWTQMARHFKDRSQYVIYEILNEPNGLSPDNWGRIQGEVIDAIRSVDQQHWIVVTGTENVDGASSVSTLSSLPRYTDNKLLYTFHFYLPYVFTHQGADWNDPSAESLAGVPFPYDRNRMPPTPNELRGTWLEDSLRNYPSEGTTAALTRKIDQAVAFMRQRNVPVFCGEFGVYKYNALPEDRIRWIQFVRETLEARNIPWIAYGYFDHFGIYNSQIEGRFDWQPWGDINTNLNIELVQALGFTPVPQTQREPLISDFTIYDDYFGRGFSEWIQAKVNLFYTQAAEGEYAIQWKDANPWDGFTISLPANDFSYLVQNGYVLEFKARSDKQARISVHFQHYQDNILWSNGFSNNQIPPDGRWHTFRIPLKDMELWDGWDAAREQSVESRGKVISWTNIVGMYFSAVHEDGGIREIYLDDIKITK